MTDHSDLRHQIEGVLEERRTEDRRFKNSGFRLEPTVVVQIVAWVIAALLTYGAVNSRIAVVESKQYESERRMQRIESKVDQLLERK